MIRGKYLTSMDDISQVLAVRYQVFVEEQGYSAELERDKHDDMAVYALAVNDDGMPVATGRLFIDDDAQFTIGRVCTLKEYRRQGYADLILRMLLQRALDLNATGVVIHSQVPAMPFYQRYGFANTGEVEYDEGVEHRRLYVKAENICLEGSCGGCLHRMG